MTDLLQNVLTTQSHNQKNKMHTKHTYIDNNSRITLAEYADIDSALFTGYGVLLPDRSIFCDRDFAHFEPRPSR